MSTNKTFIDADSIIYIASYKFKEPYQFSHKILCYKVVDEIIENMLIATAADEFAGFYGGPKGNNFRKDVAKKKGYKAHRKEEDEYIKYWKPLIKQHMRNKWGFVEVYKIEADDAVIICHEHFDNGTIASPDKDLRQVPGKIYDYNKQEHHFLSEYDAYYNLHYQLLIGDSTDNIPGCPGIGPGKAKKLLADCKTWIEMTRVIISTYRKRYLEEIPASLLKKKVKLAGDEKKATEGLKRITKAIKEEITEEILENHYNEIYEVKDEAEVTALIKEQIGLVKMLRKPAYGFEIPKLQPFVSEKQKVMKEMGLVETDLSVKAEEPKKSVGDIDILLDL